MNIITVDQKNINIAPSSVNSYLRGLPCAWSTINPDPPGLRLPMFSPGVCPWPPSLHYLYLGYCIPLSFPCHARSGLQALLCLWRSCDCQCNEPVSRNKVSSEIDSFLGWNEVCPGDSVLEQSLPHRNRIFPSTLQSLPMRKSPLYFRLLFYII